MIKSYTGNEGNRDGNNELLYGVMVRNGLVSQNVSIGITATPIPTTPQTRRLTILIINIGTVEVYLGGFDVSTANGFPLYPRAVMRIDIEDDAIIYGIVANGTQNLRIIEGY